MTSRATIGFLTTSYPRSEHDAAGVFVRGMARALRDRGHHIEVLAPEPRDGTPSSEADLDVRFVRYGPRALRRTFYGAGVPDNVRRDPRAWPGLLTFPNALLLEARTRVQGWDAIISHWAVPSGLIAGAVRADRPHLCVLHSADVHVVRRAPFRSRVAQLIASAATDLLFASAALRREFLSWIPAVPRVEVGGRSHASAMGIDPPLRLEPLGARSGRFVALVVARLVPIKGVAHAIEAVRGEPEVELWIAGDGPERAALESRARPLGERVRFLGHVSGRAKAELFTQADALLLPSVSLRSGRTEGTPTVALEGASYGLPVIASDVGGLGEVFEHERSALLVEPGNPRAIRAAIRRLSSDGALARTLGEGAAEEAERYLWAELAPRIEDLLF